MKTSGLLLSEIDAWPRMSILVLAPLAPEATVSDTPGVRAYMQLIDVEDRRLGDDIRGVDRCDDCPLRLLLLIARRSRHDDLIESQRGRRHHGVDRQSDPPRL